VSLERSWTEISDLFKMAGLPLRSLWIMNCKNVTDLSSLGKCPTLRDLQLAKSGVKDLRGLEGLKLTSIAFAGTAVSDLKPLRGMPLERVFFENTPVTDISPLLDSPAIERIGLAESVANVELLSKLPKLKFISPRFDLKNQRPAQTAEEFWAEFDQRKK
jgi:internalin A